MYEQRLDGKDFIQTMLHVLMLLVANALTAFLIRVASLRTALVQVSINLCLQTAQYNCTSSLEHSWIG